MRYIQNPTPSWLARALTFALLLLVLMIAGFGLLWYLSYGFDSEAPARTTLSTLQAPVELTWGKDDFVAISAATEQDAWTALGYAHGMRRAWSLLLWRQAAVGRLGEWVGPSAEPVDALARRLGLARLAQTGFENLPESDQATLRAYTSGINRALSSESARFLPEVVELDLYPEAWEAWHTLAVERLLAWLAADLSKPSIPVDSTVRAFLDADLQLRSWLHLHGFENSIAWVARDSVSTHLYQRLVYGASALPFLMEAAVTWRDSTQTVTGPTVPGTLHFPFGRSNESAWALLPTSTALLQRVGRDSAGVTTSYERIRFRDGTEQLIPITLQGDYLVVSDPSTRADTLWALRWEGLSSISDVSAWKQLRTGGNPAFNLLDGHGLRLSSDGTWTTFGAPPVAEPLPEGLFIAASPWAAYAADLLRAQDPSSSPMQAWIDDTYSTWAAQTAPGLLQQLAPIDTSTAAASDALTYLRNWDFAIDTSATAASDALTYLRNWDFSYDRSSIAASLFDTWLSFYRDTTGTLPQLPPRPDSILTRDPMLYFTFEQAVAYLLDHFGPDLRQWRWEKVQADRLLFPLWSVDSLGVSVIGEPAPARFAPLELPGFGHPTTIAWGPSPILEELPAPAAWESWIQIDAWDALMTRRRLLAPYRPLGRYLLSDRVPQPAVLRAPTADAKTTTLVPAGSDD